ncbi:MAG: MFS transporter [Myxococcaceae bacterium]
MSQGAPTSEVEGREPFTTQLRSFGGVFWIANWMELVERFAYYGVRVILPVFMVAALEAGGPQFDHLQKGAVYAIWALVQSFLPIFTGGFADRYGFKLNIAIATVLKIVGYLGMGYCMVLAELIAGMPVAEARAQGSDLTYGIFFAGAMFLAAGTAVFKPGLQGLIAKRMPAKNASLGWGLFYQMVNIGGFAGPLLAGYLRVLDWNYVFLACSVAIALNFIPLFFFAEPERSAETNAQRPLDLMVGAVRGLLEPRLFFFTIAFAGFWLMFYQLFDILPNFIEDWVDSRGPASALVGLFGEGSVPLTNGNLTQEWIINLNALLISVLAFAVGYFTGRVRPLTAIFIGIAISAVGIFGLGMSTSGWWILGSIAVFSIGEMAASPTKMRYLASIAPPGKEGLYMGYVNMTVGIGWSIGSILAGEMYQRAGDKIVLARQYLVEKAGMAADKVAALPQTEVLPTLQQLKGVDAWGARDLLWSTYTPGSMWLVFMLIGLGSMLLLFGYNWIVQRAASHPKHSFNTRGHVWVRAALVPIVAGLIVWCWFRLGMSWGSEAPLYEQLANGLRESWILQVPLLIQAALFVVLFVFSFIPERRAEVSGKDTPSVALE